MELEIQQYLNYKWMMSAIFREKGYIKEICKDNDDFEYMFFHESNLIYLTEILNGALSYKCFDEQKLDNIVSAMDYFVEKYKDHDDKKEQVQYCNTIIQLAKHPKGKSIKKFYKEQYSTRNQLPCNIVTTKIKNDIDKQMTLDIYYLYNILGITVIEGSLVNDIQFIRSINIFIKECPEIMCEASINQYITDIVSKNKDSEEYKNNEEFRELNDSLEEYLEEIEKNSDELSNQILKQTIFSLIFNENINKTLYELRNSPNKSDFFGQLQFDILCEFIMNNKDTCMFDNRMRENMREILFAFISENKGLDMKYPLNELKVNLNLYEDESFKQKNIEFYKNIGKHYMQTMVQYDEPYIKHYKHLINTFINSTNHFLITIVDDDCDYRLEAENLYTPCYINYILNTYTLIKENPIFRQRMEDLLYANRILLELKEEKILQVNNYKVEKKVKKLSR